MIEPNSPDDRERIAKGIPVVVPEHRVQEWSATPGNMGASQTKTSGQHPVAVLGRSLTHWAVVVACLYVLIFIAITCPLIVLAWNPHARMSEVAVIYTWWPYWVWVAVMFLCELGLLVVPVRVVSRRPVTRRPLIIPIIASGFMLGILVLAQVFTVAELSWLRGGREPFAGVNLWSLLLLPCVAWAVWAITFYRLSHFESVENAVAAQSCILLTGSILELLVAIPTHVAARNRGQCCAGMYSFVGLSLGMSVMLFAFGPAVFFLYLARWRRLRSRRDRRAPQPTGGTASHAVGATLGGSENEQITPRAHGAL